MEIINQLTPSCKEATMYASQAQDGKISFFTKFKLYFHLLYCKPCRLFVKQLKQLALIISGYKKQLNEKANHQLTEEQKIRIQQKINELSK